MWQFVWANPVNEHTVPYLNPVTYRMFSKLEMFRWMCSGGNYNLARFLCLSRSNRRRIFPDGDLGTLEVNSTSRTFFWGATWPANRKRKTICWKPIQAVPPAQTPQYIVYLLFESDAFLYPFSVREVSEVIMIVSKDGIALIDVFSLCIMR